MTVRPNVSVQLALYSLAALVKPITKSDFCVDLVSSPRPFAGVDLNFCARDSKPHPSQ